MAKPKKVLSAVCIALSLCLVPNFAFSENPTQPRNWQPYLSNSSNHAVYASDAYHSGARSLKLINSVYGNSNWHGDTITFNSPYPKTVSLSGWAKGQGITSRSLVALDFYIVFEDNTTLWYYSDTRFPTGSYNWKNKSITKTFTKGVKSIAPYLLLYSGRGTVWFDDIEIANMNNTILNPNMEQGTTQPNNWSTYNNNLNNQTGWATDYSYSPRHSLKIINTLYKNAGWVGSNIAFSQPYPKSITLGGLSKAQSVYLRYGGLYCLDFYIKFEDNSETWFYPNALRFSTGTHTWQKKELTVTFPRGIKEIQPYCLLYKGRGTVWFDDVYALVKGPNLVLNPGMEIPIVELSISVNPDLWDIGSTEINKIITMTQPNKIVVINDGTDAETFALNLINPPPPGLTASTVPSFNIYVLSGLFCNIDDVPSANNFNQDAIPQMYEDVILTQAKLSTQTIFGYAQATANGVAVPSGSNRALYLQFKSPAGTDITYEQNISVIVSCQRS